MSEDLTEWIEDHIKCTGYSIRNFTKPYTAAQLRRMETPCARLKVLYDLVDKFDIDIDYKTYNKYKDYASLIF